PPCPPSSASTCRASPARRATPRPPPRPPLPTRPRRKSRTTLMNIDKEDVLSALRRVRGKGASLKQLAGQLRLGQAQRQPLRRALSHLLEEGRATYDGQLYREANGPRPREGERRTGAREARKPQPRRAPAALVEGSRLRREKQPAQVARKPGAEITGV